MLNCYKKKLRVGIFLVDLSLIFWQVQVLYYLLYSPILLLIHNRKYETSSHNNINGDI